MSTTTKCKGCGATLQNEEQSRVGYVKNLDQDLCQSCYKLLHYGEVSAHFHPEDLPQLSADGVCFMVSSVMHLDMLFSYPVHRYQPDIKYVYIINQIDVLPKSTNKDLLLKNIINRARRMKIPYHDIILMSAKNPFDIENLKGYMESFKEKHLYLIGVQNAGKSTLFKALTDNDDVLAIVKAGLTQEAITHDFGYHKLYDMPGLYQAGYIHHFLEYQTYKKLIPQKEMKPRVYQMKKGQTLFIEGLLHISLPEKEGSVVLYLDGKVNIHKTNLSKIDSLLENKTEHFKIYTDLYETKTFKLAQGKKQVTFADIGFMHIEGPQWVTIGYPKGFHVSLSEALFK